MKTAGIIMIVLSAVVTGFRAALGLTKNCRRFRHFLDMLRILEQEICTCSTPLPQAFSVVGNMGQDPVDKVFSFVAEEMNRRRWIKPERAMELALKQHDELDGPLQDLLLRLCAGLGKYDKHMQAQTIGAIRSETEILTAAAEQECSIRGKTYRTLGICTGLAVGILML